MNVSPLRGSDVRSRLRLLHFGDLAALGSFARLGSVLEASSSVLEASWRRLGGVLDRLGGILERLGGVLERL